MFLGLAIGDALGKTIAVSIPMSFTVRGECKLVIFPDGSDWEKPRYWIDNTMVKALCRVFRWQRLLESGSVLRPKKSPRLRISIHLTLAAF